MIGKMQRMTLFIRRNVCVLLLVCSTFLSRGTHAEPLRHHPCSSRLEFALKNLRRRSFPVQKSRLLPDPSPYTVYHSIYGGQGDVPDSHYEPDRAFHAKHFTKGIEKPTSSGKAGVYLDYSQSLPNRTPDARVEVDDLRVKIPQRAMSRWVEVETCQFSTENSTLDTRLVFPDLTISGRVILHPSGQECSMILRLRHAGIEFRTTPMGFDGFGNEESRRSGSTSVRTDSHFAEPGFISVFAHSCQLVTADKVRRSSKFKGNTYQGEKRYKPYNALFDVRFDRNSRKSLLDRGDMESITFEPTGSDNSRSLRQELRRLVPDRLSFNEDVLKVDDGFNHLIEPDVRAFAGVHSTRERGGSAEADGIVTENIENLFSMGVKGLLTTYMQKSLQPAIKETLMENMGYRLSYG